MSYFEHDDCSIYYETIGEHGPWLTLINGHTRSSRDFRMLAARLSKEGVRCLLLDNRGSGATKSSKAFKLVDIAKDVQALWDFLQIRQSIVMGLSMGGMITQLLAYKFPLYVQGLILVSTGSSEKSLASEAFIPWGDSLESVEIKLQSYFARDFLQRNHLLVRAMSKQILLGIQSEDFENRARMQRDAMLGVNSEAILPAIQQPVLIIHGSEDQIIPISAADELSRLLPKSELKILAGVGHLILAESSKKLGDEILAFIRQEGWLN